MVSMDRTDIFLKETRKEMEDAMKCGDEERRTEVYSALLPQALVVAEVLFNELKEEDFEIQDETKDKIEEIEYSVIKEFKTFDLWYEPITDEIDGFVLRDKEGYIIDAYMKRN